MKFCKNLQRVVDITDPEWAPYWTNYKMLKKLIKELPSLAPLHEANKQQSSSSTQLPSKLQPGNDMTYSQGCSRPSSPLSVASSVSSSGGPRHQRQKGETTTGETSITSNRTPVAGSDPTAGQTGADPLSVKVENVECDETNQQAKKSPYTSPSEPSPPVPQDQAKYESALRMGKSPGEVAFFKLLHSELKKAIHFFDRAEQEFIIREERVLEGMEIMKKPNAMMVNDRWSLLAKSLYRLYKDLLLLETFAIMTYCSFSKILKKHDKVTGYNTRHAFMSNVVNKANFTNYPNILAMINRCAALYEEVSEHLMSEGKESLLEDERLFINMIHRLNEQVIDDSEGVNPPNFVQRKEIGKGSGLSSQDHRLSSLPQENAASSLKSISEENHAKTETVPLTTGLCDDAEEHSNKKNLSCSADPVKKRKITDENHVRSEKRPKEEGK